MYHPFRTNPLESIWLPVQWQSKSIISESKKNFWKSLIWKWILHWWTRWRKDKMVYSFTWTILTSSVQVYFIISHFLLKVFHYQASELVQLQANAFLFMQHLLYTDQNRWEVHGIRITVINFIYKIPKIEILASDFACCWLEESSIIHSHSNKWQFDRFSSK